MRIGGHDHVVAELRGLDAARAAAPRHDDGVRRRLSFEYLVPADDAPAAFGQVFPDAVGHVPLQVVFGRIAVLVPEPQLADTRLAAGALLPAHLRALVAADMDQLRREQADHLVQHVLQEFEGLLLPGAQHVVGHAPTAPHLVRAARTTQLGVGGQRRKHMARQVYLGDHRNGAVGRIRHDVADLVLRIITAVGRIVVVVPLLADHGFLADAAHGRQLRVLFDFDAPPLVVGQVPVEAVELVDRHHVEVAFHLFDRKEMARHVEVHAPVSETRGILDAHTRQHPLLAGRRLRPVNRRGQHLPQALHGVEKAGETRRTDFDALRGDIEPVPLFRQRLVEDEADARGGKLVGDGHGVLPAGGFRQLCGEFRHGALRPLVGTAVAHDAFALDGERPVPGFEVVGIRYDRDFWIVGGAGGQTHACGKGQ